MSGAAHVTLNLTGADK